RVLARPDPPRRGVRGAPAADLPPAGGASAGPRAGGERAGIAGSPPGRRRRLPDAVGGGPAGKRRAWPGRAARGRGGSSNRRRELALALERRPRGSAALSWSALALGLREA